ncbi:MAG: MBL fold metallo-hydrolase [Clostridia bacterium]|nr:MBL fold metallo-hydrolase [Clostridia bacterium]
MKRLLSLFLALIFVFSLTSCSFFGGDDGDGLSEPLEGKLRISYIDVGQGDSTFIEFPNGKTMLIDAGLADAADTVIAYVRGLGYSKIDYLMATHPDGDHIGGMRAVVNAFDIGSVYMPDVDHNTTTYEKLLEAIDDKGLQITAGKAGVDILAEENLTAKIIGPAKDEYDDTNAYSLILRITYGNHAFLFLGDATKENERELTGDFTADVVKVGHHGSTTSSDPGFVQKTRAKYAVISVGANNRYNHPKQAVLDTWTAANATILRTDLEGTIVALSDGVNLQVNDELTVIGERVEVPAVDDGSSNPTYILNISSRKIHTVDCKSVAQMKEENKVESFKTLEELLAEEYIPCGNCDPTE